MFKAGLNVACDTHGIYETITPTFSLKPVKNKQSQTSVSMCKNIIQVDLNTVLGKRLDSSGSSLKPVTGSCRERHEPSGFIQSMGFLHQVSYTALSRRICSMESVDGIRI